MAVISITIYIYVVRSSTRKETKSEQTLHIELECVNRLAAKASKLDFQQENPAFSARKSSIPKGASKSDPAHHMDTHFHTDPASGEDIAIGYPKLHILLGEMKLSAFKDKFVAHGIHTTKLLVEVADEKVYRRGHAERAAQANAFTSRRAEGEGGTGHNKTTANPQGTAPKRVEEALFRCLWARIL